LNVAQRDPLDWPQADPTPDGEDSIAGQLASRIAALPPAPDDPIDWASAAAVFEREAAALGARPAAALLLYEAARIHEERLHDPAVALEYHRRALSLDATFVPNLRAVRRLAMEQGDDALAAEVLEAEASIAPTPEARAELLLLRGRLLATLGRAEESRAVLDRAVASAPGSFAAAEEAARVAAAANDREALADAYARCARAAADRRLSAHYLSAAAALLEEGLGRPDRAGALALDAFTLLPDDPLLRASARRHAERLGRTDELAKILEAEASLATGAAASDAWLALAHLEERLGRSDAAIAALERGRAAAPAEPLVLSEIARLREARGAWADACDALEALAASHLSFGDAGHVHEAIVAKLRRAEIEEAQLGRTHQAIGCCREVIALDPGNRGALSALGRLCARAGDWEGLLAAFEAEAASARDPRDRAHRTFKAAEVLEERLGRTEDALARYREALALEPELVPARAALERLCEREGRWEELCALLDAELAQLRSPAEQIAQLFRMARLREERLADLAGAADLYRRVLELDPESRIALPALGGVLAKLGRVDELAAVLQREAELAGNPQRAVAILQRRAELVDEHLDDPERARAAWEDVRSLAPTHPAALRALGRLHARAGRWEELAAMFRAEADAAADPSVAADLLYRIGELLERRMDRVEDAVAAYREALTLAPAHLPALHALTRIYRVLGDDEHLVEVLRAQGAARVAAVERAAPLSEAARIAEERLGDPARAVEHYEEVLRIAPGFPPALRALDRLYAQLRRFDDLAALRRTATDATPEDHAERLLRLARLEADRVGDHAAALHALDELLSVAPEHPAALLLAIRLEPEAERRARARVGLAAAGSEPEPRAALLAGAALELRPASERRAALARAAGLAPASAALAPEEERRLRQAGDAAGLAAFYDHCRETALDPASRACWATRAGEAWAEAGDPTRALAAFQAALGDAPASLPALRGARALFARGGDWAAVRSTLQAEGAALQDPHAASMAWLQAGDIAESRFHDPDAALADYRAAAERAPLEPEPVARLQAALGPEGAAALAHLHEARARSEQDGRRAANAWLDGARAAADSGDRDGALAMLDRALEARPELAGALELRSRLRAQSGLHEEALADCEACIALQGDPRARVLLHLHAAAICQEGLSTPARAVPHLTAALAIAPDSADALERLAAANDALGRPADAAAALRRLVDVPGLAKPTLVAHLLALARLDERRGERASAVASCRRALNAEPANDEALQLLVKLEGSSDDPWIQVGALEIAASSSRDPSVRAAAHAKAARIHAGPLRGRAKAIEHLRAALTLDPARDDERALLAELLEETAPLAAVEEHRALIARDPLRLASWTALCRHFERTRAHDRAFVAATIVRWLGAPPPGPGMERLLLEGDGLTLPPPASLGREAWGLLRAPGDRGPLAEVIALAGDAISAAVGPPPGERGDPLRDDHPFRRLLAEMAKPLELPEYELYGAQPGRLDIEPGPVFAIRVGTDLARRTTVREQRFLLGRVAARLRSRSCLAERIPAEALAAWAASAARAALGTPGDDDVARQLAKGLGRRARRAMEPAARALLAGPAPDVAAYRAGASRTADRLGLVLCGDVPTALELSLREAGVHAADRGEAVAAAGARPELRSLLAFAASDVHFALRQRLRVAVA
jgi:tetratricopeptide (TPR) repeat protein